MTESSFHIWDASCQEGALYWLAHWQSWPDREVFAHPAYAQLYTSTKCRALCAAWTGGPVRVLYPFLMRDLSGELFCAGRDMRGVDLVTPYGYGGPFAWGEGDREAAVHEFWPAFDRWAASERVISETVRFTLFRDTVLNYPGRAAPRLQNVVRGLDLTEEDLWNDYEYKVRKNVRRARERGIAVTEDTGEHLDDFLRIYRNTMNRREAGPANRFSESYFRSLQDGLPGQFRYFHAVLEGVVIASELVLISERNVYSFLGGTEEAYFQYRPNDLLKHEIILWCKRAGKRRFILGGGYGREDGIFRYKYSFAPKGVVPFVMGSRVLLPEAYAHLVELRRAADPAWAPRPDFFPEYRS